jgi:hypothetical protein
VGVVEYGGKERFGTVAFFAAVKVLSSLSTAAAATTTAIDEELRRYHCDPSTLVLVSV